MSFWSCSSNEVLEYVNADYICDIVKLWKRAQPLTGGRMQTCLLKMTLLTSFAKMSSDSPSVLK